MIKSEKKLKMKWEKVKKMNEIFKKSQKGIVCQGPGACQTTIIISDQQ